MKENATRRLALGLLGGALLLGGVVGVAVATGVPTSSPLVWGGTVTDDAGKPYDKAVEVSVAFYDGQAATTPVCESKVVNSEAKTGRFSVVLPDACAQAVHASPDLWSETVVGPSKTKLPRVKVAAVPYALEAAVAGVAEKAGGALAGEISGLSAKVDGVVKDVADLKASPNGGPNVVFLKDSVGAVIGAPQYCINTSYCYVLTSSQHLLRLSNNWALHSTQTVLFDGKDCTGTPYYGMTANNDFATAYATIGYDGSKLRFFKPKGSPGTTTKSVSFGATASVLVLNGSSSGPAKCSTTANASGVPMEEVAGKDLGLPDAISFPLFPGPK